jgi:hypothetical protein
MRAGSRHSVALAIAQAALVLAGCQSGSATTLAGLSDRSVGIEIGDFDDVTVQLTYATISGFPCPTIAATTQAAFNGQGMELVNPGGSCNSQAGACGCEFVTFHLDGALALARADGGVDLTISDSSQSIMLSASGALMPSAISLMPPQSDHFPSDQRIVVALAQQVPPFTLAPLELDRHLGANPTGDTVEVAEVDEIDLTPELLSLGFSGEPPGPVVLNAKRSDGMSAPNVIGCQGAMMCSFGATNIVGAIPLVIE